MPTSSRSVTDAQARKPGRVSHWAPSTGGWLHGGECVMGRDPVIPAVESTGHRLYAAESDQRVRILVFLVKYSFSYAPCRGRLYELGVPCPLWARRPSWSGTVGRASPLLPAHRLPGAAMRPPRAQQAGQAQIVRDGHVAKAHGSPPAEVMTGLGFRAHHAEPLRVLAVSRRE
jgi:hypothetical protein